MLFGLYACNKTDNPNPNAIIGRWTLVNADFSGVNYAGQPGNYYLFLSNGNVIIKGPKSTGGTAFETWGYTVTTDSIITMTPPASDHAIPEFGYIKTLTAHSLVINGFYPTGFGLDFGSSMVLSR
jgi:hypothetical protein